MNTAATKEPPLVAPTYNAAIYSALVELQPAENVIVSPLLVEAALALLYLGSDGQSAHELNNLLQFAQRFPSNAQMAHFYAGNLQEILTDGETKWLLKNTLHVPSAVRVTEEFMKIAQKYFRMHISNVDDEFATAAEAAVHMTAHFKYKWFLPFSAYRTGLYDFQVNDGGAAVKSSVPFLYDEDMFVKFGEFRELDARAIELPYEHDNEMSMLLMLPNKRDGLEDLLRKLQSVDVTALGERMQMESVQVLLPKFKIDFECSFKELLQKLGITSIFTPQANFKNALPEGHKEPLRISEIHQKLRIEVHELGSESNAAHVTADKPIVVSNSIDSKKKFFRADHPFYFAIRSDELTHFVGHVSRF